MSPHCLQWARNIKQLFLLCFIFTYITYLYPTLWIYEFVSLLTVLPLNRSIQWQKLFSALLHPQGLDERQWRIRCSINMCWINESRNSIYRDLRFWSWKRTWRSSSLTSHLTWNRPPMITLWAGSLLFFIGICQILSQAAHESVRELSPNAASL